MTTPARTNLAASVHQRLMNQVQSAGMDANFILTRFATERLLYRLTQSSHADQFILKGATMFLIWTKNLYRPTMDLDLLGYGEDSSERLQSVFKACCTTEVEPDGMTYDAESVVASPIREELEYQGKRITLIGRLGNARIPLQVDIGFGDVVSPQPENVTMPTLLDFPAPALRAITRETAIAEKLHAMVVLGIANSRMKDFSDIHQLARQFTFTGSDLAMALAATFARRKTMIPKEIPLALSQGFARDPSKQRQWAAFCRKGNIPAGTLSEIITELAAFLIPPLHQGQKLTAQWLPGGPWR
jgi:predicted nucleotidyltransferase component of viral defense system